MTINSVIRQTNPLVVEKIDTKLHRKYDAHTFSSNEFRLIKYHTLLHYYWITRLQAFFLVTNISK